MNQIKKVYYNLTVEQLKKAVLEIAEQKKTGVLPDGIIRQLQRDIKQIIPTGNYLTENVMNAITWEISRRWYNGFYGIIEGFIKEEE